MLVSGSPRRRTLLEATGLSVRVCPPVPAVDETWPNLPPAAAVVALAQKKLAAVACGDDLALAADTVVILEGVPIGKPKDRAHARAMLQRMSGRLHLVYTGYVVARGALRRERAVITRVTFRSLSERELDRYLDTDEPYDKAGAYAVQGGAASFIDTIEGSYTNVIGLPIREVLEDIQSLESSG